MLRLILPLYLLAWLLFPHVFAHAEAGSAIHPVKPGLAEEAARRADLIEAQIANEKAQAEYYGKQSEKTGGSGLPAWVVPIISGVISLIGAIYSIRLAAKIAEKKSDREQQRRYEREKTQLRLAAEDLCSALQNVRGDGSFSRDFLDENLIYEDPVRPKTPERRDRYYLKYDLVDTIYRLCTVLGWMELYRNDPSFLNGPSEERKKIESCFKEIRAALGDDFVKEKKDYKEGCIDGFILEDDQRAIGEQMFSEKQTGTVVGYAAFCERLFRLPKRHKPVGSYRFSHNHWVWNATRFIVELGSGEHSRHDFRKDRVEKLIKQLGRLLDILGPRKP